MLSSNKKKYIKKLMKRLIFYARKWSRSTTTVTKADLIRSFREIGISHGDVIMVHSSLRRMGHIDGGADTVIDAIFESIGDEGTFVVPTLTLTGTMYDHFNDYDNNRPFDVHNTPSQMGRLSEVVRTMPRSVRSIHPSHSVAAVGPLAEYLTDSHQQSPYAFGETSPYYRICEKNGKFLLFGVDLKAFTAFHVIEDITRDFPYPVHLPESVTVGYIKQNGEHTTSKFIVHNKEMISRRDGKKMKPHFIEHNLLKELTVGEGKIMLIDGGNLLPTMKNLLKKGITIYS